jgi:hypothetical protein
VGHLLCLKDTSYAFKSKSLWSKLKEVVLWCLKLSRKVKIMICYVHSSASMDKRMGVWKLAVFFFIVLGCNLSSFPTVSAQTSGSISVDCGSNANYVDSVRNISWVPDDEYITNGVNGDVPSAQTYYPDSRNSKPFDTFLILWPKTVTDLQRCQT